MACTVVFPGLGNLGFTLLEYRLGHRSLFSSLTENLKWVPFLYVLLTTLLSPLLISVVYFPRSSFFFFGGLSIHLSTALLAHLFSYNITWGATKKEVERSNFFLEVPKIWRRFRVALVLSILTAAGMIVLSSSLNVVPAGWQVDALDWAVVLPLAYVIALLTALLVLTLRVVSFRIVVGCHILFPVRHFAHSYPFCSRPS